MHNDLVKGGLLEKCSIALVIIYAKCGELKNLLNMYESSNDITWITLISSYARKRAHTKMI